MTILHGGEAVFNARPENPDLAAFGLQRLDNPQRGPAYANCARARTKIDRARYTIAWPVELSGIGLHSGQPCRVRFSPAKAGRGLVFILRNGNAADAPSDLVRPASAEAGIDAHIRHLTPSNLCTALDAGNGHVVRLVEHALAALAGLGVDDAEIRVDGPELPILDGSAAPFCDAILAAGLVKTGERRNYLRVLRPVEVRAPAFAPNGPERVARLLPRAECGLDLELEIDFPDLAIRRQSARFTLAREAFVNEVSFARTFGFAHEVEALREAGLARGGSLDNAVVVANGEVLNPEGLRHAEEFVRHKLLDAIGDLALAGGPIWGTYEASQPGHALNGELLRALLSTRENWAWELAPETE